jgi:Zn-dependent alcohol dehydrogenase
MARAAVQVEGGSPLVIQNLTAGDPLPDEVVVSLVTTGVCHTDVAMLQGVMIGGEPLARPLLVGHEGAGVVAAVGSDVTDLEELATRCRPLEEANEAVNDLLAGRGTRTLLMFD